MIGVCALTTGGSMAVDLQDLSRRPLAAADQLWTNSAFRHDQYALPAPP
jgi:hypothetical protein